MIDKAAKDCWQLEYPDILFFGELDVSYSYSYVTFLLILILFLVSNLDFVKLEPSKSLQPWQ
jgi:hypothetical protein